MNTIPCLFVTYNRLDYTKQSLEALIGSDVGKIVIIDNASTDGTQEYIKSLNLDSMRFITVFNDTNTGIAGAMNQYLQLTKGCKLVAKVDNDTIVPAHWCHKLAEKVYNCKLDIIQAKHNLDPAVTKGLTFDEWTATMPKHENDACVHYHHFVGGSGIVFRRNIVDAIPYTDWKLYGWRQFQREHPHLRTAFCSSVVIRLLDGGGDYSKYVDYYKETKRLA
jgi:glycosyltransferase involved in cell wall biosynthesis